MSSRPMKCLSVTVVAILTGYAPSTLCAQPTCGPGSNSFYACPTPQQLEQERQADEQRKRHEQQEEEKAQSLKIKIAQIFKGNSSKAEERGYRLITRKVFALDGRELAKNKAKVSLIGKYSKDSSGEFLTKLLVPYLGEEDDVSVPLITEGADRKLRGYLLDHANIFATSSDLGMIVLGTVGTCIHKTLLEETQVPCLYVDDGWNIPSSEVQRAPQPIPNLIPGEILTAPNHQSVDLNPAANYRAMLSGWFETHKRYPNSAQENAEQGSAIVHFRVDSAGRVLTFDLSQSTGYADLDQGIADMMRGAQLPAFPPGLTTSYLDVTMTLRFSPTR
jgi:TonB family protein